MKAHAPATERNREPILGVLSGLIPENAAVLEVASGTGEHAAWFAKGLPGVAWQPTDTDDGAIASISAWRAERGTPNLRAPVKLDVTRAGWEQGVPAPGGGADRYAAVVCINMIHIAPWSACLGLLAGAARLLGAV